MFAMLFAFMGAFVVLMAYSAANNGGVVLAPGQQTIGASTGSLPIFGGTGLGGGPIGGGASTAAAGRDVSGSKAVGSIANSGVSNSGGASDAQRANMLAKPGSLDKKLATALQSLAGSSTGRLAVGVVDETTGRRAIFSGSRTFPATSVESTSILAALLLSRQQAASPPTRQQAALAAAMMEDNSFGAGGDLYHLIGGTPVLAAANAQLQLNRTVLGPHGAWRHTMTTVTDQLKVLQSLTSRDSVLSAQSRRYALTLMERTQAGQRWGVSAASSIGTSYALKDGWLHQRDGWATNSIGIVKLDGHVLLIAVLANDQPTTAAGITIDSQAAALAARVITAAA